MDERRVPLDRFTNHVVPDGRPDSVNVIMYFTREKGLVNRLRLLVSTYGTVYIKPIEADTIVVSQNLSLSIFSCG